MDQLDQTSVRTQPGVHSLRKTYKEKLRPTPAQQRALEEVLGRCRALYNTALEQRITAWQRCHVSVSRYQQEAELLISALGTKLAGIAPVFSPVIATQAV